MAARVERWMMPYLTGKCFDFALALADEIIDPVFVAVGAPDRPDHVGLRVGDRYVDVRGVLTAEEFLTLNPDGIPPADIDPDEDITVIDRSVVELHAGLCVNGADGEPMPYEDSEEFRQAVEAVDLAFAGGWLDGLEEMTPSRP